MSADSARPVGPSNSIKRATVGLVLDQAPDANDIQQALSIHDANKRLRERYPRRQEHRAATITVNARDGVVRPVDSGALVGFAFDRLEPDGEVAQSIACIENTLRMVRSNAVDLAGVQTDAREEFGLLLPRLDKSVARLVIERLDRFVWDGDYADFGASVVFRSDSKWLTPNVFSAEDMWHSHHGLFEYRDHPQKHRLLHTVEVQVIPSDEAIPKEVGTTIVADVKQSLDVLHGLTRPRTRQQTIPPAELLNDDGLLSDYLAAMISASERTLAGIIRTDICHEIGLSPQ